MLGNIKAGRMRHGRRCDGASQHMRQLIRASAATSGTGIHRPAPPERGGHRVAPDARDPDLHRRGAGRDRGQAPCGPLFQRSLLQSDPQSESPSPNARQQDPSSSLTKASIRAGWDAFASRNMRRKRARALRRAAAVAFTSSASESPRSWRNSHRAVPFQKPPSDFSPRPRSISALNSSRAVRSVSNQGPSGQHDAAPPQRRPDCSGPPEAWAMASQAPAAGEAPLVNCFRRRRSFSTVAERGRGSQ